MSNKRVAFTAWFIPLLLPLVLGVALAQDEKVTHGAELLAPLKIELKQALVAGMAKGPLNAISVCKDLAPAIADSLSIEGVEMGRTSHRLRNPANSAPDWVSPVIETYLGEDSDRVPKVVSLANNREGYVEPIMIKPLCLACHGSTLAPDVAAHLSEAYPEDVATGFDVGDLRGVYWVEYPEAE
jgi:hypothetical protein